MEKIKKELVDNKNEIKRRRVAITFTEPSLTKQEYSREADMNTIIKKYRLTGQLPPTKSFGTYADVSNIGDYQSAVMKVQEAQEVFDSLPARIRSQFENNPAQLIDWVMDPKNKEDAITLGLLESDVSSPGKPKGVGGTETATVAHSGASGEMPEKAKQ